MKYDHLEIQKMQKKWSMPLFQAKLIAVIHPFPKREDCWLSDPRGENTLVQF